MHLLWNCVGCFLIFHLVSGNDPFEGNFPTLNCLLPRIRVTGCNETLIEAYNRTGLSKTDENTNAADTRMFLFTRRNKKYPEFLHKCGGRLPRNSFYGRGKYTVIIVGGYISAVCTMAFFREYKDQFLYRGDHNVILIDWPWGNGIDYYSASRNTKVVGKQIAFMIQNIMDQTGESAHQFHIIGHSLGSHIAGFAGQFLQTGKIRRITGLDPAGVNFIGESINNRLDPSDAEKVDIIHSNAGECFPFALGYPTNIGHSDFYPNGGSIQLSCYPYILISMLKLDLYYAFVSLLGPFCPHFQSVQYFKESINACNCQFVGVECNSHTEYLLGGCRKCGEYGSNCAVMGLDWEDYPHKLGNYSYYLDTSPDLMCPNCDNSNLDLGGFPSRPTKGDPRLHCFPTKAPSSRNGLSQARAATLSQAIPVMPELKAYI